VLTGRQLPRKGGAHAKDADIRDDEQDRAQAAASTPWLYRHFGRNSLLTITSLIRK
jgi:hypothetical protein